MSPAIGVSNAIREWVVTIGGDSAGWLVQHIDLSFCFV